MCNYHRRKLPRPEVLSVQRNDEERWCKSVGSKWMVIDLSPNECCINDNTILLNFSMSTVNRIKFISSTYEEILHRFLWLFFNARFYLRHLKYHPNLYLVIYFFVRFCSCNCYSRSQSSSYPLGAIFLDVSLRATTRVSGQIPLRRTISHSPLQLKSKQKSLLVSRSQFVKITCFIFFAPGVA